MRQRERHEEKQTKKWEKGGWAHGGVVMGSTVPDLTVEGNRWDNPVRRMAVVRLLWVRKEKGKGEGEGDVVEWGQTCERCREKAMDDDEGERKWNV